MNFYMYLSFVWWSLHFNGLYIIFTLIRWLSNNEWYKYHIMLSWFISFLMWLFCYFPFVKEIAYTVLHNFQCSVKTQDSEILLSIALSGQTEKFCMIFLIFSRLLPELHERALSVILCTSDYIISTLNLVDIHVFKQHVNDLTFLRSYGVT